MSLDVFTPIKLNLMLHVTDKRADGYHNLQSLITFLNYGDQISISPADHFQFSISGSFASSLSNLSDNLVIKAANWVASLYGKSINNISINLHKLIPISSGIGGGSSDAAATIYGLIKYWGMQLNNSEIDELIIKSGSLGADVPVCLSYQFYNNLYFFINGTGKEGAIPLLCKNIFYYVLINPLKVISTPEAFKKNRVFKEPIKILPQENNGDWLIDFIKESDNTLKYAAGEFVPEIDKILEVSRQGAVCSRLSGSGATCFAMFDNAETAKKAEQNLKKFFPNYWVMGCSTFYKFPYNSSDHN